MGGWKQVHGGPFGLTIWKTVGRRKWGNSEGFFRQVSTMVRSMISAKVNHSHIY